jgi:hypothetical protein
MIKKLFAASVLVVAAVASTTTPAPAIDFICRCDLCKAHPGLACWDTTQSPVVRTSCSTFYARRCGG